MSDRLFESFSFNLHKWAITRAPRIRVLSRNRRARAKTYGWMATEQLKIRSVQFGTAANVIDVTILNTGTSPVTITEIHVNNGANLLAAQFTVPRARASSSKTTRVICSLLLELFSQENKREKRLESQYRPTS
jgi:hypothetical protein